MGAKGPAFLGEFQGEKRIIYQLLQTRQVIHITVNAGPQDPRFLSVREDAQFSKVYLYRLRSKFNGSLPHCPENFFQQTRINITQKL